MALKRTILSSTARAQHVIALSATCREILIAHGIAADKVCVISNGVEPPAPGAPSTQGLNALRERWSIPQRFMLCVSHFYPYKNFERLVAAFATLEPDLRAAHPLVLVGAPLDRRYFEHIRSVIDRLGVRRDVILIPGLDAASLAALYGATTLFVYPSLVENSPNILLEAMAHGAPVLAGAHDPMPEFGGTAVRYVDVHSSAAMAEAMAAMLRDPQERARLREQGPARAARYSWDGFTRAVVALYRQASPTPRSVPAKPKAVP